jgi:hypothetical protein
MIGRSGPLGSESDDGQIRDTLRPISISSTQSVMYVRDFAYNVWLRFDAWGIGSSLASSPGLLQ